MCSINLLFLSRSVLLLPIIPTRLICSCFLVLSIKDSVIMNPEVQLNDGPLFLWMHQKSQTGVCASRGAFQRFLRMGRITDFHL